VTTIAANFFDGQTSERRAVQVKLTIPGYIVVQELGTLSRYKLEDVSIPDRIGSQPARVTLPDGALLEISDSETFYTQLAALNRRGQWTHALESRWAYAILAVGLTLMFAWFSYIWVIPEMAKRVAYALPAELDQELGEKTMQILDEQIFAPSELDPMRQLELLTVFMSVVKTVGEGDVYRYQLLFRRGDGVGANAFALPAGVIVLTDEMVELAQHDDELAAVLAHEVGHIRNRHALRAVLQNSVVAVLIITLTGDASSATSLAAGIPTVLANAGYSRDFEYEADAVAKEYLLASDLPLHRFADIILRLDDDSYDLPGVVDLLDTHPEARERAREFR
jgi:Zn-dependent protease with chaperone function